MRWPGFRRVRRQVCRRLGRRLKQLRLPDLDAYRRVLVSDGDEWKALDAACRITVSRFYRDRWLWLMLEETVLPSLAANCIARRERQLRCLSVGCASGEEPYTLSVLWQLGLARRFPELKLRIDAFDVDPHMLERARRAAYSAGSLKDLPDEWRRNAFETLGTQFVLKKAFRDNVHFESRDVRDGLPDCRYDLVLCRNLVFTYYDLALQTEILARLIEHMIPGGMLVIGGHESLPEDGARFVPRREAVGIYRPSTRESVTRSVPHA
jgi:chemotaxis protein methyltransferase CheR